MASTGGGGLEKRDFRSIYIYIIKISIKDIDKEHYSDNDSFSFSEKKLRKLSLKKVYGKTFLSLETTCCTLPMMINLFNNKRENQS